MKNPLTITFGLLLAALAPAQAELGATATLLHPSTKGAGNAGFSAVTQGSLITSGFAMSLYGSITYDAGSNGSESPTRWNVGLLRVNDFDALIQWADGERPEPFTPDDIFSSFAAADGRFLGGYDEPSQDRVGIQRLTIDGASLPDQPVLWLDGTTGAPIRLVPPGASSATVTGITPGLQVGQAIIDGSPRAVIWRGSALSAQDVTPVGAREAGIAAAVNQVQAGYVVPAGSSERQAAVWAGSAASFTNLQPAGATASWLQGTDGRGFAGAAIVNGQAHAGFWSQASPASFVDLHPVEALSSEARAVSGDAQVGTTTTTAGATRAAFWKGNAGSYLDLHLALPTNYTQSEATYIYPVAELNAEGRYLPNGGSIWTEIADKADADPGLQVVTLPAYTLVGGNAYNADLDRWEAVMWRVEKMAPPVLAALNARAQSARTLRGVAVGNARRVIVRTNGERRVLRGGDFRRQVRIATQSGRVLRATGKTVNKIRVAGLKTGDNTVIVTAVGPGGRARPLRIVVSR